MRIPTGRSARRIPKAIGVAARFFDGPSLLEGTFMENISIRGARIVTKTELQAGGLLEIHFPSDVQFHSRVVYCQQLPDGKFGVGLEILSDREG